MRISDWSSDVCSSDLPLAAGINDLQEMSKTHEAISKAKTQTWYRILTHYLPLYFPEIERFAGNSRSDWFLAMIERFPTPGSIASIGREDFTEQVWPLIGRKGSKARVVHRSDGRREGKEGGSKC